MSRLPTNNTPRTPSGARSSAQKKGFQTLVLGGFNDTKPSQYAVPTNLGRNPNPNADGIADPDFVQGWFGVPFVGENGGAGGMGGWLGYAKQEPTSSPALPILIAAAAALILIK